MRAQKAQLLRYIDEIDRRQLWAKRGYSSGRCAFVGDGGRRCDATRALEFAHAYP